jgi:hypothetical protein
MSNYIDINELAYDISSNNLKFNICDVSSYTLTDTKILSIAAKDSASPTIVAFSNLLDRKKNNADVTFKISLNTGNDIEKLKTDLESYPGSERIISNLERYKENECGLLYEAYIYSTYINALIYNNVSPNFVPYVGFGNCDITENISQKLLGVDTNELKEMFKKYDKVDQRLLPNSSLNILIIGKVPDGSMTLKSFIKTLTNMDIYILKCIVFQLIYTIRVIDLIGVSHYDLHFGNIFVIPLDVKQKLTYQIEDGTVFSMNTSHLAMLYDWDHSFSEKLGENIRITSIDDDETQIFNKNIENLDLSYFLCHLLEYSIGESHLNFIGEEFKDLFTDIKSSFGLPKISSRGKVIKPSICRDLLRIIDVVDANVIFHKYFDEFILSTKVGSGINTNVKKDVNAMYSMHNIKNAQKDFDFAPLANDKSFKKCKNPIDVYENTRNFLFNNKYINKYGEQVITNFRGDKYYYVNAVLHRYNNKPAIEYANGDKYWYSHGILHRENDKPAIEYANGDKSWYNKGVIHRDNNKPAIEYANGDKVYYTYGEIGRFDDEPSIIISDGSYYYFGNQLHRFDDKPAIVKKNGYKAWYIFGEPKRLNPKDPIIIDENGRKHYK